VNQEWVTVAVLGKPRGNRGELTGFSQVQDPARFDALREVYLFGSGERYTIETTWLHKGVVIFKFAGIDSISDAEPLAGAEVRIPLSERAELEPGAYFHSDLIGCTVRHKQTGEALGKVSALDESAGSGMLVLEDGTLIPFARSICVEIAPERREIVIDPPEGLLELNRP
jgi:16S rRNA processing protein RimM